VKREEAGNFSDFAPPSRQSEQNTFIITIDCEKIPAANPNGNFRRQTGKFLRRTANQRSSCGARVTELYLAPP
jgi:hypothetical protein